MQDKGTAYFFSLCLWTLVSCLDYKDNCNDLLVDVSYDCFSRADTESLPCLIAMVSEHHKELADIPEHVKVRHPHTFFTELFPDAIL